MAAVARNHGGDCGGDDGPPNGGNWPPDSRCQASGGSKRGKTRNIGLKATIEKTSKLLKIEFEQDNNNTYVAVGPTGDSFNTLAGTIVSKIPLHFESWKKIPPQYTTTIIPEIQTYFDLSRHFAGSSATKIRAGIIHYCKGRYRDQKNKFKKEWIDKNGGIQAIDSLRNTLPSDISDDHWNKFLDLVASPKFQARSNANKGVRRKRKTTVHQGRKTLAQNRYDNRDPVTREPPSLLDEYRRLRSRNGQFTTKDAAANYARMMALKEQQAGLPNPMSDTDIVRSVAGTS